MLRDQTITLCSEIPTAPTPRAPRPVRGACPAARTGRLLQPGRRGRRGDRRGGCGGEPANSECRLDAAAPDYGSQVICSQYVSVLRLQVFLASERALQVYA